MRHADGEPGLGLGDRFSAFAERRNDDSFEGREVGGERFAARSDYDQTLANNAERICASSSPATSSTTACSLESGGVTYFPSTGRVPRLAASCRDLQRWRA